LEESYRQNEQPVYRLGIEAPEGKAKFGTQLDDEEKRWLLGEINAALERLTG